MKSLYLLALLSLLYLIEDSSAHKYKSTPFSDVKRYSVSGIISLPYAEINEPFRAWYDETQFASRIDYYDGMVSTIQLAPSDSSSLGVAIKIAPLTDETRTNVKTCFWTNGTELEESVTTQSVLPDTTDFTFVGEEAWKGYSVDKWQSVYTAGDKKNTYTFLINSKTNEPLYYEMIGYDSLLGSHYDRYYIEYFNYQTNEISPSIFSINTNLKCRDFPGPGAQSMVTANPMQEFFHHQDNHVLNMFKQFQDKHSIAYATKIEHQARSHVFRHNLRYIQSFNRKGLSFSLAVNHLADKTDEELSVLRGRKHSNVPNSGLPFDIKKFSTTNLPQSFDWRIFGAVTPVKDQGICGSCWSFGTTGAIEGAFFVKNKQLVRFSPQNLIDCSWGFGNNGCDGGEDFRAYDWIMKHGGIATEDGYGPYLQQDGYCHFDSSKVGARLAGYVNVTAYDATALKTALVNEGPISIAIDAGHKSMVFYSNGIYYEPDCGNSPDHLDHAVLLVGYGTIQGQGYWLVKNSWSTYWGNDGYILMSQKDNNCGVTTQTTYPIIL